MDATLERLCRIADGTSEYTGRTVSWLLIFMMLAQAVALTLPILFGMNFISLQESITYMHACLITLAIPYALKHNEHVRVDVLYRKVSARRRAQINLAGCCLFLLPVCTLIVVKSLPYVISSWRAVEGSTETSGLPGIFLLKTVIPLTAVLLALQGLAQALRAYRHLRA